MSESNTDNRGSGQRRRRSRGGRNRNRNNNQQGNRDGNRQGGNRQGANRQGGNRQGNRSGGPRPRRAPKPKPLTWWQKLLKAIGLYKEPGPSPKAGAKSAPKSNVRNARTDDSEPKPERKPREKREKPEHREPVSTGDVTTKRIYLGNLSYEATESDLEELFRGVGTVRRVEVVYDRRTHRSKGYGFVEMLNVDEAKRAVEILHDQFFMGRKLNVDGAKSQGPADADHAEDHPGDEAPTPEDSQPPAEPQNDSGTKPQ